MQPASGKSYVFLFDDLNMSKRDKWGHQSSNELLRQWFNHGGWYASRGFSFRRIKDVNFAGTVSLRQEKELLDERLGWNYAAIGFCNFAGCHIEPIYTRLLTYAFANVPSKRV